MHAHPLTEGDREQKNKDKERDEKGRMKERREGMEGKEKKNKGIVTKKRREIPS